MVALALDIGETRIGIAVSSRDGKMAMPVKVLPAAEVTGMAKTFRYLVEDYEPDILVSGRPLTMAGEPGPQAERVTTVAQKIADELDLPLEFEDERLSSQEAKRILREQGLNEKQMRGKIDMIAASLFLQTLVDDYIVPMTQQADPDFAPLAGALLHVGGIYLIGILAAWCNARIMVNVTQGTLRNLRIQLFTHMESLPISYFDTHPHGDIMSVYTNDVDTLRQMLSQSIPQLVSSVITIVSVFFSMCMLSWQLTIVTMLMVALMLFCSKQIAKSSSKYFIQQQRDLGKVNGYIEEMMEGQKVVKVFTHEQQTLAGFRELNDQLKESAKQANAFSNIMMPVNAQLGNISYAICALTGAAMAVGGVGGMTLGTVVAFLSLNKGFNMPISQVSMQANSVIMALAGAERIFKMMDEPSETDEGYVTLVNAKYDRNDQLVETNERTGIWAWKHPHHDGTTTYHKLEGSITFAFARKMQFSYVRSTGGYWALREADKTYNDWNREQLRALKMMHGRLFLGSINFHGDQRKKVIAGKEGVYEELLDQMVYNFGCDFAVPTPDKELEKLIRAWNEDERLPKKLVDVEAMTGRVEQLGGINLIWY